MENLLLKALWGETLEYLISGLKDLGGGLSDLGSNLEFGDNFGRIVSRGFKKYHTSVIWVQTDYCPLKYHQKFTSYGYFYEDENWSLLSWTQIKRH